MGAQFVKEMGLASDVRREADKAVSMSLAMLSPEVLEKGYARSMAHNIDSIAGVHEPVEPRLWDLRQLPEERLLQWENQASEFHKAAREPAPDNLTCAIVLCRAPEEIRTGVKV